MIPGRRFAAIDIGSNAVRLLLSEVFETDSGPYFRKISLVRMPIRLGKDAFITGKISRENADRLRHTIQGFKCLVDAYRPLDFRACATSAMRESSNGEKICNHILDKTGVDIEIIDGKEEARTIFANNAWNRFADDNVWIFVDVGGGSTEITIFSNGKTFSHSFGIGTIRLLESLVHKQQWKDMKSWIRHHTRDFPRIDAVGSGGNINSIIKLANCKNGRAITYGKMKKIQDHLNFFSYEDRISKLGLKPDRADVIMPAIKIYMSVMKWGGVQSISVPQIGLADGMVRMMYRQHIRSRNKQKHRPGKHSDEAVFPNHEDTPA